MILMTLVYCLFAIMAIMLYGANDVPGFKSGHRNDNLFRVSTMEDWTDVMYINMLGCANWLVATATASILRLRGGDVQACGLSASGYWAALFFSVFVIISGYVVMSLFIGVIAASMQEETDRQVQRKKAGKQKIAKYKARQELANRRSKGIVVRPSEDLLKDEEEPRAEHEPNHRKVLARM